MKSADNLHLFIKCMTSIWYNTGVLSTWSGYVWDDV